MSLFMVPIAVVGLDILLSDANPDFFVLTLPLSQGQDSLAILASISLSKMVSNHVVVPFFLQVSGNRLSMSGDVRKVILTSRCLSSAVILLLGHPYYSLLGRGSALIVIDLVSFAGVVQVLPALIGGIFWRGATRLRALWGGGKGFGIWLYILFISSLGLDLGFLLQLIQLDHFEISWLRPQVLFGISGLDPLVHAVFWGISLNSLVFIFVSLISFPSSLGRLQAVQFVNTFDYASSPHSWNDPGWAKRRADDDGATDLESLEA